MCLNVVLVEVVVIEPPIFERTDGLSDHGLPDGRIGHSHGPAATGTLGRD